MDTYQYRILLQDPAEREPLQAFLTDGPFTAFMDTDVGFDAWSLAQDRPQAEAQLRHWQQTLMYRWEAEFLPNQNWNAQWEQSFQAVEVGQFVRIRANFHPRKPGFAHELLIEPRMAFGTGHHATTYLMIELMEQVGWANKRVIDFGSGTGVLAILAAQLGADPVLAVDIEAAAVENTHENAAANGVDVQVFQGDLSALPLSGQPADIILANINRNVILGTLDTLYEQLRLEGSLFISGILNQDGDRLRERLQQSQFKVVSERERAGWLAWHVRK